MEGKVLYSFREKCEVLGLSCHKNVNRILSMMNKYPDNCKDLQEYTKCCLNLEKLCSYLCDCCCNCDKISEFMLQEYKLKCECIMKICDGLMNVLSKKDASYIRCDTIKKICNKKMFKKSKKKKKYY